MLHQAFSTAGISRSFTYTSWCRFDICSYDHEQSAVHPIPNRILTREEPLDTMRLPLPPVLLNLDDIRDPVTLFERDLVILRCVVAFPVISKDFPIVLKGSLVCSDHGLPLFLLFRFATSRRRTWRRGRSRRWWWSDRRQLRLNDRFVFLDHLAIVRREEAGFAAAVRAGPPPCKMVIISNIIRMLDLAHPRRALRSA